MNGSLTIRCAVPADIPHIITFNQAIAQETEGHQLSSDTITAGVEELFHSPQYGFYMVACEADKVIASLLVTFEWSDWRNGLIWWVQSVYVLPEWRRRGVYRKFYQHVKTLAEAQGNVCGFRLYVDKENRIAQQTYRSLGMQDSRYSLYEEIL